MWEALGLQLRRETSTNEFTLAPGALHTYYLQHVSEHSALITPTGVPCVYISTWHCDFSFVSKPAPTCFVGAEVTRPKILSKIVTLKLQPKKLRRFAKRKQFLSHTTARQQRRQSVVQRRTAPTVPPAKLSDHVTATEEPEFCSLPLHMQYKRLEHLMYAALSSVLGLRRKLVDIRIKHSQALTLVDIAPTVFNTLHLQVRLLPVWAFENLIDLPGSRNPIAVNIHHSLSVKQLSQHAVTNSSTENSRLAASSEYTTTRCT